MDNNEIKKIESKAKEIYSEPNYEAEPFLETAENIIEAGMDLRFLKIFVMAYKDLQNIKRDIGEDIHCNQKTITHERNLEVIQKHERFWELESSLSNYCYELHLAKQNIEKLTDKYLGENNEQ
jgi:hypothetical protein